MPLFLTATKLNVPHGFSLRTGGVSAAPFDALNLGGSVGDEPAAVAENLRLLLAAAGLREVVTARQVHGDRVVDAELRELLPATEAPHEAGDADALVARRGAVGVRVADCVPVLLHDERSGAVAAAHSGWRGTRLRIAGRVARLLGAEALVAAIGPCIGRCCYEVSPELAQSFRAQFGEGAADDPARSPHPHLDLRFCVAHALREAGVAPDRIEQVPGCTSCDSGSFYSHRRDKGRTGRHLAFIAA